MIGTINKLLKGIFGDKSNKQLAELQPIIDKIHSFEAELENLNTDQVRNKTVELKQRIADHLSGSQKQIDELKEKALAPDVNVYEKEALYDQIDVIEKKQNEELEEILDIILPEAFAVLKETAKRFTNEETIKVTATEMDRDLATTMAYVDIEGDQAIWQTTWDAAGADIKWAMVHYDVQLIGGYSLHKGKVAEMQTGEGKTLVATLPMYLNALAGRGVHLVTVNDYLARRDSEWMAPIFEFHGLTIDCIDKYKPHSPERIKAYNADITYGTNNEFGFDYLRDNMAGESNGIVQRKHHYAIVDEVDSVLIDDARTPLIISGPTPKGDQQLFDELKPNVQQLFTAQKNFVTKLLSDAKKTLTSGTTDKEALKEANLLLFRAYRGLPKNKALIKFLSEDGIKAQMQKTENYYLAEQSKHMPEVDKELYFVIDEKANSIDLTEKGITLISGPDNPNFFIMPDISTELDELEKKEIEAQEKLSQKEAIIRDYSIKSERIHTINQLLKAYTLFEKDVDYVVMGGKVQIVDEQTGRIMDGRRYSDGLHQAIESKEAVKVEAATQTYASVTLQNYFRMYHKLSGMTGTAETEASELWDIYKLDVSVIPTNRPIQRKDEQDKVYRTKREKYNAIIEEIAELSAVGRPVLVGTTSVEVSELLSKMLTLKKIDHQVLNAKLHQREADIVAKAGIAGTVTIATNMAGRGTDIKLSEEVKAAGGLAIVGSEKHDSRRVDRQLRGRSGRQGDPGSSQFYLSLEDNLMRLFGSERVASIMDRLGLEEGEVIQHSMITKSIERAQKKVEENNFGIRKRLLEYDDVLNAQREVIYKRRRHALYGDRLRVDIANMFQDAAAACVSDYHAVKDYSGFELDVLKIFGTETKITAEEFEKNKLEDLIQQLEKEVWASYKHKNETIATTTFPVIKDVYENQQSQYKNIVVPFTDGVKAMQIPVNLETAYKSEGKDVVLELEKRVVLSLIDDEWKEHLREMDHLRQSVQFASHEQKDPLLIYKFESFELFKAMITRLNNDVVSFLMRASLPVNAEAQQAAPQQKPKSVGVASRPGQTANAAAHTNTAPQQKAQPAVAEEKIGRNDACPCGSGKKYKQCHGKA
tara:strand:+ start:530498 stop:533797 length:3300 start_codon:yes stop_codon:yes gene_type:complete